MLEQNFLAFLNDHQLITSSQPALLAVSGGLDSMVMAELFYRTGQLFAIAHVNFGLRGAESDADALFVQNKAEQYGVPFHINRVDTKAFATEQGISIQMAARTLRYTWFAQLCQEYTYAYVATAHHLNDVLETVLLNLTRGTGLAGLHGIAVQQNGIVRPLLFATRDQLAAYVVAQQLAYREDSSNQEDKYARNRIRHHVVPVLTDINPALWQTLPRTLERFRSAEVLMEAELDRSWKVTRMLDGEQILLPIDRLRQWSELAFRLASWLKPFGFTSDQITQMIQTLQQQPGQVFRSATHQLTHERNGLLIKPLTEKNAYAITISDWPTKPITVNDRFTVQLDVFEKPADFRPTTEPTVACLDADQLTLPLTIRPWQQGDRFRPLGVKGTKLVSDLLTDVKVKRSEREEIPVLLSGDQIAWVIGHRVDHRYRIKPETTKVCRVTWQVNVNEAHDLV